MPEDASFQSSCGERLREVIAARARRSRGKRITAAMGAAVIPIAATTISRPSPIFVWNASSSTPRGLYLVTDHEAPKRGDMVVAALPTRLGQFAANRHYLPLGVPLVKRVAAIAGDLACASKGSLSINGRPAGVRRNVDALRRRLPQWSGCVVLRAGDVLLVGDSPWSFDGRYFGPMSRSQILGRVKLLWRA